MDSWLGGRRGRISLYFFHCASPGCHCHITIIEPPLPFPALRPRPTPKIIIRETRDGWPLLTVETDAKWGFKDYKWKGSVLGWFKRFLFGLGCSSRLSTKYFFFTVHYVFQFLCPHRPASWSRICKPFKEPRNRFPACGPERQPYLTYRHRLAVSIPWDRFPSSLNVYKYGLWAGSRAGSPVS